jgi:hypothetical protein
MVPSRDTDTLTVHQALQAMAPCRPRFLHRIRMGSKVSLQTLRKANGRQLCRNRWSSPCSQTPDRLTTRLRRTLSAMMRCRPCTRCRGLAVRFNYKGFRRHSLVMCTARSDMLRDTHCVRQGRSISDLKVWVMQYIVVEAIVVRKREHKGYIRIRIY